MYTLNIDKNANRILINEKKKKLLKLNDQNTLISN